jgi:copper-binding protein NosD
MKIQSASILRAAGLFAVWIFIAGPASGAPATRTWVSVGGDDANACTRATACRTFAVAIAKTAAGGEIDAIDPADYGPVEITKAITIDGGAGTAAIFVASGNGIVINAGSFDTVVLRNLSIGGGGNGILVEGGRNVLIEHCAVSGPGNGIVFFPVGPMNLTVADTTLENNQQGITVGAAGAFFARLTATHVRVDGSSLWGMVIGDNALVFVSDSSVSNSKSHGIFVQSNGGGAVELDLENVSISNNGNAGAVAVNPGAVIRLSNCSIDHSGGAGVVPLAGGLILSFGNNKFAGNAAGDGTINGPLVPK